MKAKRTARRVAVLAALLALASVLFIVESLLPPLLPMAPYVKIGLANAVVLFVIAVFGVCDGFIFILAKNLLTALITGGTFALAFNLAGSISAYLVMAGLYLALFPKISLLSVSVAGAVVNNIARTAVGVLLMEAKSLYLQLPVVSIFGACAGIIVGALTIFMVKYLPERLTKFG